MPLGSILVRNLDEPVTYRKNISRAQDLFQMGQKSDKNSTEDNQARTKLRCFLIHTLGYILLNTEGIFDHKTFSNAAWGLIADRVVNDGSKRVIKAALLQLHVLFCELHGETGYLSVKTSLDPLTVMHLEKFAALVTLKLAPHVPTILNRCKSMHIHDRYTSLSVITAVLERVSHPHCHSLIESCWMDRWTIPNSIISNHPNNLSSKLLKITTSPFWAQMIPR